MPAQLDDTVVLTLVLRGETQEWADDKLREIEGMKVERLENEQLVATLEMHGNCNSISNAVSFLQEIEFTLLECRVDPMEFTLIATVKP